MFVCVYVNVCMYVCVHAHNIYGDPLSLVYVCAYVCICECMADVCMCVLRVYYVRMCVYVYVRMCMCVRMCG